MRLVEAAERGIRVWSLTGEYNLATADGRRHFREAMVAAAGESDKIAERVADGKVRRARKGRTSGGARSFGMPGLAPRPAGWEPGDPRAMAPDEQVAAERAVIAECYERILGGEPLTAVVRDLNRRGITTVNGKRWTRDGLRKSLTRPVLAGLVMLRGEVVSRLAGIDPVVQMEDWERLCAVLDGRPRGRPAGAVHQLAGLMACQRCGHTLHGMVRKQVRRGAIPRRCARWSAARSLVWSSSRARGTGTGPRSGSSGTVPARRLSRMRTRGANSSCRLDPLRVVAPGSRKDLP